MVSFLGGFKNLKVIETPEKEVPTLEQGLFCGNVTKLQYIIEQTGIL